MLYNKITIGGINHGRAQKGHRKRLYPGVPGAGDHPGGRPGGDGYYKNIDRLRNLPHIIDPAAAARFDGLVKVCDTIAQEFFGRMTATVDLEYYEANIELELDYIEFYHDHSMDRLLALLRAATNVRIVATSTNRFRICAYLPYFITVV